MSCHRVNPMPQINGVRVIKKDEIAAVFLVRIE
jgi:hypothetical protein